MPPLGALLGVQPCGAGVLPDALDKAEDGGILGTPPAKRAGSGKGTAPPGGGCLRAESTSTGSRGNGVRAVDKP